MSSSLSHRHRNSPGTRQRGRTHLLQQHFQLLVLAAFDQSMLVVDVFDDEFVIVLAVDFVDDGFDARVAFD